MKLSQVIGAFLLLGTALSTLSIESCEDLYDFSKSVNNGTFSDTTVMINSVIDCVNVTEPFVPIGIANPFNGTFFGNGYKIKNLNIESDEIAAGLFGRTSNAELNNIVLDPSCSVKATVSSANKKIVYAGGIVGYAYCTTIKGCLNFADVTFSGVLTNDTSIIDIGGIVGNFFIGYNSISTVKDSANYGSIIVKNEISGNVHMGGVIGMMYSTFSNYVSFTNCLNYGLISVKALNVTAFVGGIIGESTSAKVKYCVNAGQIDALNNAISYSVGSIIGRSAYTVEITNNYYINTNERGVIGSFSGTISKVTNNKGYDPSTFIVDFSNNTDLFTILKVNSDAISSIWVSNTDSHSVAVFLDCAESFEISKPLFLLPGKVNNDAFFARWYLDEKMDLGTSYDIASKGIVNDTTLWGGFGASRCDYYKLRSVSLVFYGDVSESEWKPFVKTCAACNKCYEVTGSLYFDINDETLVFIKFDEPEQARTFIANAKSSTDPLAQKIKSINLAEGSAAAYVVPSALALFLVLFAFFLF